MKPVTFYLQSPSFWVATAEEPLPDVSFVPPLVRRRMTPIEKITLALIKRTLGERANMPMIFASQHGEWAQTHKLLTALWKEHEVSPAAFTASVHNASLGIASIVMGNTLTYTTVAARARTLESGLLEALISPKPILLVAAEEKTVDFYAAQIESPTPGHGFSVILSQEGPGCAVRTASGTPGTKPLTVADVQAFFDSGTPITTEHFSLTRV